jgi:kumamolisin
MVLFILKFSERRKIMSPKKRITIHGSKEPILSNASVSGAPAPDKKIEFCLHLRFKPSSPGLHSLDKIATFPNKQRKHITHEEFDKIYGALPGDVKKVEAFAEEYGLQVTAINTTHRTVHLTGTVAGINNAFAIKLNKYKHKHIKDEFMGHEEELTIPEELKDIVIGVLGLVDHPITRPPFHHHNAGSPSPQPPNTPQPPSKKPKGNYYTPIQLAELYNFPKNADGKGQSIGILELAGGYKPDSIKEYFEEFLKIPMPTIKDVSVSSGKNNPGESKFADAEVCADIEVAGAMAPGAQLVVYFAPSSNYKGFISTLKAAVHDNDNQNSIISISWGQKESHSSEMFSTIMNETLQVAAHLGITVCIASGDFGSIDTTPGSDHDGKAHVDFPSSSPWSLACGGTTIEVEGNTIKKEVVWNNKIKGATGGGVSELFECPPYQSEAGINPKSVNKGAKNGRGVPDVAANANPDSGYLIKVNDAPVSHTGGTSVVAPLWAALMARMNEKLEVNLGFFNTLLYKINRNNGSFNDITEGNNQIVPNVPGYPATPGWDACTGLGTPNGEKLLAALKKLLE